ncbi:MAG: phosphotransferase [Clostridia bacterium]|jgi:serine/threonine-protein kinase
MFYEFLKEIKNSDTFIRIEPIDKGWSDDKKYYIETVDNKKLLLRVSDISQYDRKKAEFEMMKRVYASGVPMSEPLDFGTCDSQKSVYILLSWCEGKSADEVLTGLQVHDQYMLGIRSGEILKLMHSIPAPDGQEDWNARFTRKVNYKINKYRACGIRFNGDDRIIEYIEKNRQLLVSRPQCYQHGDYHVGNMIISHDDMLSIIDFNRQDHGDPWEEFNRIVWSVTVSPAFATGQINGYFNGKPPTEFFRMLAFYISSNTLSSIYWAIPFGDKEIATMMKQAKDVLEWFSNMDDPVPAWYMGNLIHWQYLAVNTNIY